LDQFALQVLLILEFLLLQLLLQSQRLQLHQQDLLSLQDLTVQLLQLFLYLLGQLHQLILWHQ
jgi:hypothetical protein